MKLTTDETRALGIARMLTSLCGETPWVTKNHSPLMTSFLARPDSLKGHEVELTATMHGGIMSLWFTVDRMTWFGMRRKPVADTFSMGGDETYDVLRKLFNAITSSDVTRGL